MFNQFWDYATEVHGTHALVGPERVRLRVK